MNITEIKPHVRKFNIELDENELKLLSAIVGNTGECEFKDMLDTENDVTYEPRFTHTVYSLINRVLKS